MQDETNEMREEYDFLHAEKNPYVEHRKKQGNGTMAMVRYELNESRELTAAERQQLERAKAMPAVYDEDSPELDEKMEAAFVAARKAKPYRGQPLTVYVSPRYSKGS